MKPLFNQKSVATFLLSLLLSFILISCKDHKREAANVSNNIITDSPVKAPMFELVSTTGQTISMEDYKGKTLVIHIATTWCPYCNAEAPHLEQLSKDYKNRGVEVLIIDVKEPKDLIIDKLVNTHKLSFPVLLDSDGAVAASFAPKDVLPELSRDEIMLASNIIIDQQGAIQFMSLLDTKNFDSKLIHLKKKLDELLQ
ncbi:peroxiredoxin family protein [Aestuariivivens insulae]|uniref:peroxiredoxin family protein n=1 Tax=Aestuariivivens insulae TaxID=1621988 RepID=UPI001F561E30|nr:TlpA disulfide reductase family protein [Aestuariivivens insulae]